MAGLDAVLSELGLDRGRVQPYGDWALKIPLPELAARERVGSSGKLVLVTAMTPTPHGEGKTVTAIGLAMALARRGRLATVCLRQPSLGPVFGLKGGAAGGGRATVEPAVRINLGLTGDIAAIESAHNLLAALVDNHIHHGNSLRIDPARGLWPRTLDMNDRALRRIALDSPAPGSPPTRPGEFVITASSEVMAIHGLAESYADLKERLGRIIIGWNAEGAPVRARDLKAGGAMAALLRDALAPNLVLTQEGTPAFVHGGPFGNIAHGTASLASIRLALSTSEIAVVEAGFGSELGAEKFVDLVSPLGGLVAATGVIVATTRALRYHGGASAQEAEHPDLPRLREGLANLLQHIENVRTLGLDPVVALNRFPSDDEEEVRTIRATCEELNVAFAMSHAFRDGGAGALPLAEAAEGSLARGLRGRPIYPATAPVREKVERITRLMYGGDGVVFEDRAEQELARANTLGAAGLPVCVSKTAFSLSDDPHLIGRPRGFRIRVDRVELRAGAGYTILQTGRVNTMPGLPIHPAAEEIDLTAEGEIVGVR